MCFPSKSFCSLLQVTSCEHVFCKACLLSFGQASCPTCSKLLTVDFTKNVDNGDQTSKTTIKGFRSSSILNRIQLDDFQTSTKIEALVCVNETVTYVFWNFSLHIATLIIL